jgi:hypothetical protein
MGSRAVSLAVLFASVLLTASAHADLVPPGYIECKFVGDVCDLAPGNPGLCAMLPWTNKVQCDAGGSPCTFPVGPGTCCVATQHLMCAQTDGGTDDAGTPAAAPGQADNSTCSVRGVPVARTFGPWAIAGSVWLLALFARRRARR